MPNAGQVIWLIWFSVCTRICRKGMYSGDVSIWHPDRLPSLSSIYLLPGSTPDLRPLPPWRWGVFSLYRHRETFLKAYCRGYSGEHGGMMDGPRYCCPFCLFVPSDDAAPHSRAAERLQKCTLPRYPALPCPALPCPVLSCPLSTFRNERLETRLDSAAQTISLDSVQTPDPGKLSLHRLIAALGFP